MVNPTGYTALDLVGFTDKGTFAANVNYVRNDLVHYGGNIWLVLIDDTIGITPSEGVNYTLFIGEPTNLVERIIAPLEENPATIAYTTGRQFIYNDYLYEVIDDIAVGDALIAYEDDPTNANIKLASPVETQVLALKSEVDKHFVLTNQHLPKLDWTASNTKWVQSITDARITATSFAMVYFNDASLSAAAAANIVVDSFTGSGGANGGIQFTADSVPVMTADADLVCDIVVTNP